MQDYREPVYVDSKETNLDAIVEDKKPLRTRVEQLRLNLAQSSFSSDFPDEEDSTLLKFRSMVSDECITADEASLYSTTELELKYHALQGQLDKLSAHNTATDDSDSELSSLEREDDTYSDSEPELFHRKQSWEKYALTDELSEQATERELMFQTQEMLSVIHMLEPTTEQFSNLHPESQALFDAALTPTGTGFHDKYCIHDVHTQANVIHKERTRQSIKDGFEIQLNLALEDDVGTPRPTFTSRFESQMEDAISKVSTPPSRKKSIISQWWPFQESTV